VVALIGIEIDYTRNGVGTIGKIDISFISTTTDYCFIKIGITQS
jgi:hypothetical protein